MSNCLSVITSKEQLDFSCEWRVEGTVFSDVFVHPLAQWDPGPRYEHYTNNKNNNNKSLPPSSFVIRKNYHITSLALQCR